MLRMHRDMRQGTARWDSVSMGVGSLCPNHLHLKKTYFTSRTSFIPTNLNTQVTLPSSRKINKKFKKKKQKNLDFLIAIKKFQSVFKNSNSKSFHYNLPRIFKTQLYFINKSNPQRVKQKTTVYKARIILGKKKKACHENI